jgi:hypothetical protein
MLLINKKLLFPLNFKILLIILISFCYLPIRGYTQDFNFEAKYFFNRSNPEDVKSIKSMMKKREEKIREMEITLKYFRSLGLNEIKGIKSLKRDIGYLHSAVFIGLDFLYLGSEILAKNTNCDLSEFYDLRNNFDDDESFHNQLLNLAISLGIPTSPEELLKKKKSKTKK